MPLGRDRRVELSEGAGTTRCPWVCVSLAVAALRQQREHLLSGRVKGHRKAQGSQESHERGTIELVEGGDGWGHRFQSLLSLQVCTSK
jgi:hypothetical protein